MPIRTEFFTAAMGHLKDLEAEVLALTATIQVVRSLNLLSDLDETLAKARLWAGEQMNAKYDAPVGRAIQQMQMKNDEEELMTVLSQLKPAKYPN
jgi:uncharacterized membrane protein YhiD involved in acid resistance